MKEIRYLQVSEGSSDQALLPVLNWLLRQHTAGYAIQDLKRSPVEARVWRMTQFIHDFALLRALEAFQSLEKNVSQVVRDQGWVRH